jgi:Asp-tRNA(Asn)/Glu-tRNA(Gln) amidotransferase A subunit family amidase
MSNTLDRRGFFTGAIKASAAAAVFPLLVSEIAHAVETNAINKADISAAAMLTGVSFSEAQQEMMLEDVQSRLKSYGSIHDLNIPNGIAPALDFNPVLPGMTFETARRPLRLSQAGDLELPKNLDDCAFYSVRQLAELVRRKKISSLDLTQMYLARLRRYDPTLHFVVTLTEDRALAQAKEADRDIAAGKYRGPLHGIPWGAKDLIAVKGYPTTWGAGGFEKQSFEEDATVVKRLDAAGAVLIAKLTLGALAMGDVWFGGMTRNPWKADQGSSGSSAGSASATAAGCVAFAIGSETLGSISSPSTRCGATGLRPTFGRIPRTGAMALSWSMDKLGPLCRSAEDCAIVLNAVYGPDGHDRTVHDYAFNWDADLDIRKLRIGFLKDDFEHKAAPDEKPEDAPRRIEAKKFDDAALDVLRTKLKIDLIPVELPKLPWGAMRPILLAEAAAAFDDLTRSGRDNLLTAQGKDDWPNAFRAARFIPAVEYVNGNRARMMGLQQMADVFKKVDVIVAPTFSTQLLVTNLTGHPALILPSGFREKDGTPVSLTFLGNLFGEASLLAMARAWEQATDFHSQHPKLVTEAKG